MHLKCITELTCRIVAVYVMYAVHVYILMMAFYVSFDLRFVKRVGSKIQLHVFDSMQ